MPIIFISGEKACPECAHPEGAHAVSCPRSELEILKRELEEIVRVLERFGRYDPEKPLADQLREMLRKGSETETKNEF